MTGRQIGMSLLLSAAVSGCRSHGTPSVLPQPLARDAAVYAAALDSLYPRHASETVRLLALHENTTAMARDTAPDWVWTKYYSLPGIDSTMARDFAQRSSGSRSLRTIGPSLARTLDARLAFLADSDFATLHRLAAQRSVHPAEETTQFWKAFYQAYPARWGSISVSAIGYSGDGDQAIVYVRNGCGGLCGRGQFVLLRRVERTWTVVRIKPTSVS